MSLTRRILTEKRRLIYPLVVALVANAGLYLGVVYPLSLKVARGEADARAAAAALATARRDYESARGTVTGKQAADAELAKFYGTVLPPDLSAARRITSLKVLQLARSTGVSYDRASSEATHERDSALGKLTTTVMLSGQYRDIRRFIYAVETAPEFLVLENVALSQGTGSSQALNVIVKVATYYREDETGAPVPGTVDGR